MVHRHTLEVGHPVLASIHEKGIFKAEGGQGSDSKIVLQVSGAQGLRQAASQWKLQHSHALEWGWFSVAILLPFLYYRCTSHISQKWEFSLKQNSMSSHIFTVFTSCFLELYILENPVREKSGWIKDFSCLHFLCPAFYKFKSLALH